MAPIENQNQTRGEEGNLFRNLRVAIVHYWFARRRGGERVVEALAEMFPQADLFALVADRDTLPPPLRQHTLQTSFLQRIPGSVRWHRFLLPLYPIALEQFDLRPYDLVLSSESGPAKGVLTSPGTCHICYCHSPMRYIWDLYPEYRAAGGNILIKTAFALTSHYVRLWDLSTSARVDHFVANSRHVAARIRKHYGRQATVIYPPVGVSTGVVSHQHEEYYLVVSELVRYKRIDLAIQACNQLGRRLCIIGDGEESRSLRRLAGPMVEFLGYIPDAEVREHYARCRALLFPGEEDFGIVPVEAQSFGKPVIAYGKGGVLETVAGFFPEDPPLQGSTGIFFREQSAESLAQAIQVFERVEAQFSPLAIRAHVEPFDEACFRSRMGAFIAEKMAGSPTPKEAASPEERIGN